MTDRRKITAAPPARPSAAPPNPTGQGVMEDQRPAHETLTHSDWSRRMLAWKAEFRLTSIWTTCVRTARTELLDRRNLLRVFRAA